MNLAICDDHLTFIESLELLLGNRGHRVVGRSNSPHDSADLSSAEVDAIIVDLQFPGIGGSDAVGIIRDTVSSIPIVVLTASSDLKVIEQAFDRGANGAVLKTEGIDELEAVLLKVEAANSGPSRADLDRKVRSRQVQAMTKRRPSRGRGPHLTERELEVLEGLVGGRTTAEIAKSIGVEISTVRTYVQHLLAKFGAHSRLELVASARRAGLA
ncbi:MAG TPA: response regulator transcription factor [Acidimicrobiales bacterium]|nr:response regulator transcription factor [Acidimicrobiales bacterium]